MAKKLEKAASKNMKEKETSAQHQGKRSNVGKKELKSEEMIQNKVWNSVGRLAAPQNPEVSHRQKSSGVVVWIWSVQCRTGGVGKKPFIKWYSFVHACKPSSKSAFILLII